MWSPSRGPTLPGVRVPVTGVSGPSGCVTPPSPLGADSTNPTLDPKEPTGVGRRCRGQPVRIPGVPVDLVPMRVKSETRFRPGDEEIHLFQNNLGPVWGSECITEADTSGMA